VPSFLREQRRSRPTAIAIALLISIAISSAGAGRSRADEILKPDSPEVKKAVARAVEFLESDAGIPNRLGAQALVGLVLLKNGAKKDHPRIVNAVRTTRARLGDMDADNIHFQNVYSPALAVIFLITLDPSKYATEIQCLLDYLQKIQKDHGGWGYPEREKGDTSMTQYGVLATWEAINTGGFRVPKTSIESVTDWLLKTQDPSGAFGYQGVIGTVDKPEKQTEIRHSMSAAGLGSVYICADMLGIADRVEVKDDGLPAALVEVKEEEKKKPDAEGPKTKIDPNDVGRVKGRGNRWMAQNFTVDSEKWNFYYLYALERYMSFREMAEGRRVIKWYHQGARYLIDNQEEDGSWEDQEQNRVADTAFATLFLLRSTKKSIEKVRDFGEGMLVGGRGFPKNTADVHVRKGEVVARPLLGPAEQLLAVLEDPEDTDFEAAADLLADLPRKQADQLLGKHAKKLKNMIGDRSVRSRLAAVSALANSRDLENVPVLIYALSDPDLEVVVAARDALRRLTRKPTGFGLGKKPSEEEVEAVIKEWKAWYLAIRPDAEFED